MLRRIFDLISTAGALFKDRVSSFPLSRQTLVRTANKLSDHASAVELGAQVDLNKAHGMSLLAFDSVSLHMPAFNDIAD